MRAAFSFYGCRARPHPSIVFSSFVCGAHERLLYQTMSIVGKYYFHLLRNFVVLSGRVFPAQSAFPTSDVARARSNLFFTLDLTPASVSARPTSFQMAQSPPAHSSPTTRSHCTFSVLLAAIFIWSVVLLDRLHASDFYLSGVGIYFDEAGRLRLRDHRCAPSHTRGSKI